MPRAQTMKIWSFNSTLVRLEATATNTRSTAFISFNSTLVRLEERVPAAPAIAVEDRSFNSTLVRLEDGYGESRTTTNTRFQFHTGSIRSSSGCPALYALEPSFNSTLVRLEDLVWCSPPCNEFCFNSTLVRLEDG